MWKEQTIKTNYYQLFWSCPLTVQQSWRWELEIAQRLILIEKSYKKFINQEFEYPGLRI